MRLTKTWLILSAFALSLVIQNGVEASVVENELNPGVTIYRVSFKNTAEGNEENVMNVYIKNNTNTIIDNTYDGIYDLIKIVMASASKVEK